MFSGVLIEKDEAGQRVALTGLDEARLPEGDVTVDVDYSTLNYKDALAITGKSPVVRSFPMVPGIDFAGVVTESSHAEYKTGDRVILNGWGVGEKHWGGLAQKPASRANGSSRCPRRSMTPGDGHRHRGLHGEPVRGRADRISSEADPTERCSSRARPVASAASRWRCSQAPGSRSSGRRARRRRATICSDWGASSMIARTELSVAGKPLQKERWAAVVDSVGSHTLVMRAPSRYGGAVAACGLAQGMDFPGTVAPFILRGVTLIGIDSVMAPKRPRAWTRGKRLEARSGRLRARRDRHGDLARPGDPPRRPNSMDGTVRGRVVVDVNR